MSHRTKQILIGFDQLANTFLGGWADETISSRSYRERRKHPKRMAFIDFLFYKGHCHDAYLSEKERLQEPPALRKRKIIV